MSRAGSVFRRCGPCSAKVEAKRCGRCGSDTWSWAFVVDVAPRGAPRKQRSRQGFASRREAQSALNEAQSDAEQGRTIDLTRLTVGEWLEQWLSATRSSVRPGTWNSYELHVRYIAPRADDTEWTGRWRPLPHLGAVPLQSLDRLTIRGLYAHLTTRGKLRGDGGLSPKTVHNIHLTLHKALGEAVEDLLLPRNPAEGAHRLSASDDEAPTWTGPQVAAFVAHVEETDHRQRAMFRLALASGLRRGELAGLAWDVVDLDAGTLTVVKQRVKGTSQGGAGVSVGPPKSRASRRSIDLDAGTVAGLREHHKRQDDERTAAGPAWNESGLVFVRSDGSPLHPDQITSAWNDAVASSNLPRIRLHDARHTHATLMLKAGVSPHLVSRRLGHSSVAFTLARYAHVIPGQQAEAAQAFADDVFGPPEHNEADDDGDADDDEEVET